MQKQLSALTQREMTRKEFMATVGFGVASIMGFSTILRLFGGGSNPLSSNKSSQGYGAGGYGR